VAKAHAAIESGKTMGSTVLLVDEGRGESTNVTT
jgi:hypothetical protein